MMIYDVLRLKEVKDKIPEFIEKPNKSVLDLGCSYAQALFFLYHDFGFENLVGVDKDSLDEILGNFNYKLSQSGKIPVRLHSIYDLYCFQISFQPPFTERDRHLTEQEFYQHFKFYFNKSIIHYCRNSKDQFDLVILCNVIHFIDNNMEELVSQAYEKINKGGLIFVRVNHPDIIDKEKHEGYRKVSDQEFIGLFENKFEQAYLNQRREFDDGILTIGKIYLGKK